MVLTSVVAMISWDGRTRKVVGVGRPLNAASVDPSGDGWLATVDVARGVDLASLADSPSVERVWLELWKRPAADEAGVAVVQKAGKPVGLAGIPICGCGERGCANAHTQLSELVTGDGVDVLFELARSLPIVGSLGTNQQTRHGSIR